jgi:hypothetical protein
VNAEQAKPVEELSNDELDVVDRPMVAERLVDTFDGPIRKQGEK